MFEKFRGGANAPNAPLVCAPVLDKVLYRYDQYVTLLRLPLWLTYLE